jgi:AraC family transcriptional regulator, alkane utilization regulator
MDVLSDVLRVVRMSGSVFFTGAFSSPWALDSPAPQVLSAVVIPDAECVVLFHILVDGECRVECEGQPVVSMQAGDVVAFPHGDPHVMRSVESAEATPLASVISQRSADDPPRLAFGGGGRAARFICSYLSADQRFGRLVEALPTILLVRSSDDSVVIDAFEGNERRSAVVPRESGTWLATTLAFTINEARATRPGNTAMLGRLTELMFVSILREYIQRLPADHAGWLTALNDASVGHALRLLHADPARQWTVDVIAREVGASRSALAQRFVDLIGETPMRYLTSWRMELAKQMMRDGAHTIQAIAERVGYDSEAAFNRAFKRVTGAPPATWRKNASAATIEVSAPADRSPSRTFTVK